MKEEDAEMNWKQELKQEWKNENSVLPGLLFLAVFLTVGVSAIAYQEIERYYLGPNRPVKITIHVPAPPPTGTGGEGEPGGIGTVVKPADPDEVAAFNEWMAQAELIVRKTGDKEAKEVWEFLKERALLATPSSDGTLQLHEVPKRSDWIAVMPFLERHKFKDPNWEKHFFYQVDSTAVAYFAGGPKTPTRLIVMKTFLGMQDFNKGTTVLHEGWHAYDIMTRAEPFSHRPGSYAYQHDKLWVFEDRLTRLMGDPTFSRLLAKERATTSNQYVSLNHCWGEYRTELEQALHVSSPLDVSFVCSAFAREAHRRVSF